jgi:hypothetical protein
MNDLFRRSSAMSAFDAFVMGCIRLSAIAALYCSSSDNLRPIRHFENGGSGSSGVRV